MTAPAARREHRPAPFTRRHRLILILLMLLATAIRFHDLDAESIWYDESLSALFASQTLDTAITSMLEEGLQHSPLYYLLLRPFAAYDFNEFSVRYLPALLGILTVPLIAQLGRIAASPRAGVLAAALLTINPFHVWYSRETRMYTLVALTAVAAMYFFAQNVVQRPRARNWLGLAIATAIAINTHHFAYFVPLAQFVFIILTFRRTYTLLRAWVAAQVLAGLSLIPWILTVLDWGKFYGAGGSAPITPGFSDWLKLVWNFSLGYTERVTVPVMISLGIVFTLLAYTLRRVYLTPQPPLHLIERGSQAERPASLVGFKAFHSRGASASGGSANGYAIGLLWVWFVLPPAITLALSLRLPMYVDRYMIVAFPAFIVLLAASIDSLPRETVRRIAAGAVIVAMVWGLVRVYTDDTIYERADWRAVAAYLEEHVDPTNDRIATKNYQDLIPFHFYYDGAATIDPIIAFDQVTPPDLPPAGSGQRFWLVIPHENVSIHLVGHCQAFDARMFESTPELWAWYIESQHRLVETIEFTCIRVEVYK